MAVSNDAAYELNKMNALTNKHSLGNLLPRAVGKHTTAGGDVNEVILVTDMLATDVVSVGVETKGSTPVTIVEAKAAAGQIEVELSADPSTDHVLSYIVHRA